MRTFQFRCTASSSRKFLAGRPLKYIREEIITAIADIPYRKRSTYRKLAAALALQKSTVFDKRRDVLQPHSSALKPKLSEDGKIIPIMMMEVDNIIPEESMH